MNKSSNEPSCTMTKSLTKTNKKIETPVKQNLRAICPKHKVFFPALTRPHFERKAQSNSEMCCSIR